MGAINEIFRTFGSEYVHRFGASMPYEHRKSMEAIIECRTPSAGIAVYECEHCQEPHIVYKACGNRHCPTCQHHKTRQWLEKQMERHLPGHHFMLTFTVPEKIRPLIRSNQRLAYSALFSSSSDAIRELAKDDRLIGGDLPGFFGVLHTWGRTLSYHPHIHYVVTGGALSVKDHAWHPSRIDFYLPVKALSKIFKGKFLDEMKKAGLFDLIPQEVQDMKWNVNSQAVGQSYTSIKYLAPYVFKVAISNSRIVNVEGHSVSFKYRKPHSNRWRIMTLDAIEFIRRFLQHVLPSGFMKVRHFGYMNPNCNVDHNTIAALIELSYGFTLPPPPEKDLEPWRPITCPKCGGKLILRTMALPHVTFIRSG
jgi:hypothetical protein